MSRRSKKSNDNAIFNLLLFLFLVVVITPTIPVSICIIVALGLFKIRGQYVLYTSLIILLLVTVLIPNVIISFLSECGEIFQKVDLSNINIVNMAIPFMAYSFSSWVVIVIVSSIIAGYFAEHMNRDEQLKQAGVTTMDTEIKKLGKTFDVKHEKKINKDISTLIGYNQSKKPVYCADNSKHIFVCGTTGSGKTVALSNFIESGIMKNYGMLIIDGKGDIGDGSIFEITKKFCMEQNRELLIVDMNNPIKSAKYNPFKEASNTMCKDMLINMTDWSEEHYKSNAERYLQRLIKLLEIKGEDLSFTKIIEHISVNKFEELSVWLTKEKLQSKEEHLNNLNIAKSSGKITENASARFSTIAESEIGVIFDENGIDVYRALTSGAVILFILNPLKYPETSISMGRLILIDIKQAMSKMFGNTQSRSFFVLDEINVYASPVLIDLINKSRSANITCIPATQSLADLESVAGESFKQQIIENCNNYLILRQNGYKSAEEWAKTIGTVEKMKMTYKVSKTESTGQGSARPVREFIVHPDEIKAQSTGQAVFLSKDNGKLERIKVHKPF